MGPIAGAVSTARVGGDGRLHRDRAVRFECLIKERIVRLVVRLFLFLEESDGGLGEDGVVVAVDMDVDASGGNHSGDDGGDDWIVLHCHDTAENELRDEEARLQRRRRWRQRQAALRAHVGPEGAASAGAAPSPCGLGCGAVQARGSGRGKGATQVRRGEEGRGEEEGGTWERSGEEGGEGRGGGRQQEAWSCQCRQC